MFDIYDNIFSERVLKTFLIPLVSLWVLLGKGGNGYDEEMMLPFGSML